MAKKRVMKKSGADATATNATHVKPSPQTIGCIVGLLVIIVGIAWIYNGLTSITVEGFDITGVQSTSEETIVLTGELRVNNPSIVSVPLRQLEYDVTYKGKLLGHGSVPQTTLGSRGVSVIPLTQEVRLVESSGLLIDVAFVGSANITIEGTASLDIPLIGSRDVRFGDTIDVGPIIIERVKSAVSDFIDFFLD